MEALLLAEHRRHAPAITADDLADRDRTVRRAAARALARIGGAPAREGLLRALSDEDDEVVAWAAYGLGFSCAGHEKPTVAALVARFLGRQAGPPVAPGALDPLAAIARAVGRCGAEESEPTLVAWLAGPPAQAVAAAYALGDLASAKQKLREETLVALFNLAAGSASAPPLPEALYPAGRLKHLPLSVTDRLREVAVARLATPGEARLFAVRALARAGEGASSELARILATPASFNAAERAEAARGLGQLGKPGQRALAEALPTMLPGKDPLALAGLVSEDFDVLLVALESLSDPSHLKEPLGDLAALAAPPGAPAPIVRRVSLLRCAAARVLAGSAHAHKLLAACDLAPASGIGARAAVAVLGKAEIVGARFDAWQEIALRGETRAREAALELLDDHEEIDAAAILAEALAAKEGGVVATAAEVVAKHPQRANAAQLKAKKPKRAKKKKDRDKDAPEPPAPSPALVKALLDALARPVVLEDPEIAGPLVDAAGALALKEAKPRLDELCRSPWPTAREHAEKALALISPEKKACTAPEGGGPPPDELGHLTAAAVTLSLDTDAGALTITLDPTLAPVAVTRFADLARAGFYDGIVVHRVVPGFVAQFGAPFGDGFGGPPGKPPLRCETSPVPFAPLAVGVALDGRDTGSSQLFVMHARHPHLDGLYARVGTAAGPWAALTEGDVIRKVKVAP
jgi:cyclophilin family peptidyl-prolyl cis-trans isomerase/HEAT repeat protein